MSLTRRAICRTSWAASVIFCRVASPRALAWRASWFTLLLIADNSRSRGGVLVGWTGPQVDAQDQVSYKRVCAQLSQLCLMFQAVKLLIRQPDADVPVSCSHLLHLLGITCLKLM